MKKSGISHIEVILSMVLFITFVIIGLAFFNPATSSRFVSSSLEYASDEILDEIEIDLESFSVVIKEEWTESEIGVEIIDIENGNKGMKVVNSLGVEVPSSRDRQMVYFTRNPSDRFFSVLLSEGFDLADDSVNPVVTDPANYDIGSASSRKVVSEEKTLELQGRYDTDYEDLKTGSPEEDGFNLAYRLDFSFSLIFSDKPEKNIEAVRDIPSGLEVFSDVERVEVLTTEEELTSADLLVKIW